MTRIRVPIIGGNNKSVLIDTTATKGATLGVDFLMPDGTPATPAKLAAYLGVTPNPPNKSPNSSGSAGAAGKAGQSGPPGDDGFDGEPGPPGSAGPTGATGAIGPGGAAGTPGGPMGPPGQEGSEGSEGPPGPPGPAGVGAAGPTGAVGMIGPPGTDGIDGDDGAPGPPGATGPAGTGTAIALPGTIPDLALWWESDDILGASTAVITRLRERTPWVTGIAASNGSGTVAISATQLNSLNVLKWPAATAGGQYTLPTPFSLAIGATFFIVANGSTSAGAQTIIGGTSGIALYLGNLSAKIALVKSGVAVIGTSTATWVAGTAFQANATYDPGTGNFAFRQAQAAAGSGTGTTGAGSPAYFGADSGTNYLNAASLAALIIYNRVLSGTEIANVENYLNAKWGV